ncbi:arginine utilization protein RocB [Caldalkalibacillus uzonensis]|uniref:Arginine utilization protein RocB n=1 Tax=Caldalkalibacillus uzonensis TaxID=353224 RepID=A0ABU0CTP2_9BACI|nr:M20/M25/M40 family metallo-hydrolase [Caldalkalibacillus uzonensis]MDQ0339788.1 arginine utilization protein RocB [Caldalkalibacillus uzonensis]
MKVNRTEMEQLVKDLISHASVVNTQGEREMAEVLYRYIVELPYFQQRPEQVLLTRTYHDYQERYNVIAYVRGSAVQSSETVILMGHFDTVGMDDYGAWQGQATDPDQLKHIIREYQLPPEVQAHAHSEDWLFGRGSVDMKSGVASHLYVLKHFAQHPEELQGNILVVLTSDEEDSSHGIRSALKDLRRIKEKEGFAFIAAINSDYTSARYSGDENRYIYVGTVGKLLPTFFIAGKETHVGQVFEGFDPNLIISELTREIDYNPLLCDELYGEWTLPPVSLKQTDLKPFYDVQTPLTAFAYYNLFVHSWSPDQVLEKLKAHGLRAFERAIETYQERYELYGKLSGTRFDPPPIQPRVYTFEEYYQRVKAQHGSTFERTIGDFCQHVVEQQTLDIRSYACRVVEQVWKWDKVKEPVMIVFYSNLYIPRVAVSEQTAEGSRLIRAIGQAVEQVQPDCPKPIVMKKFYPYISDMSYMALSDGEQSIHTYEQNVPVWGERYRLNVEDIRAINVPVCNIGPYGFDAHKKFERLELTYSLEIVPLLTYSVIRHLLAAA